MRTLFLILAGIGLVLFDGAVLPALRITAGFGLMVILISLILSFGVRQRVVAWGLAAAFCFELGLGIYFGVFIGAWLIVVWLWYFLNNIFNIKPLLENNSWLALFTSSFAGLILFAIGESGIWLIRKLAYDHSVSFATVAAIFRSPEILTAAIAEFLIMLILIKVIYRGETSIIYRHG